MVKIQLALVEGNEHYLHVFALSGQILKCHDIIYVSPCSGLTGVCTHKVMLTLRLQKVLYDLHALFNDGGRLCLAMLQCFHYQGG